MCVCRGRNGHPLLNFPLPIKLTLWMANPEKSKEKSRCTIFTIFFEYDFPHERKLPRIFVEFAYNWSSDIIHPQNETLGSHSYIYICIKNTNLYLNIINLLTIKILLHKFFVCYWLYVNFTVVHVKESNQAR